MPAEVIFGDIRNLDPDELRTVLQTQGIKRIDTAARYMNGESERNIGKAKLASDFTIDTKILYTEPGDGTLTADAIEESLTNSLAALGVEKVHILYCHGPDNTTPVAEQAQAFDEQYKKGRFSYLGVSNFTTSMLREWLDVAEQRGYVKPSVFQGQYNLVCRSYEETLFPLLRKHKMRFGAYSPLAGGFLLGNFTAGGVHKGARFASEASPYRAWYDKPAMHEAIQKLRAISSRTALGMDELSLRWLEYHSRLGNEDWMILGASKISQIAPSCQKARNGPLNADAVRELDDIWATIKEAGLCSWHRICEPWTRESNSKFFLSTDRGLDPSLCCPILNLNPSSRVTRYIQEVWQLSRRLEPDSPSESRLNLPPGPGQAAEPAKPTNKRSKGAVETAPPRLDALRRLSAPLRPRAQSYNNLRDANEGRDAVPWYWRLVALASSVIILGGFLILPVTFDQYSDDVRPSSTAVGIFAVALLAAGFALTGLVCFAVRVAVFRAESIFMPALVACFLGLLTVFYDLLVYERYKWNTPALLITIAAAVSSAIYAALILYTYRNIHMARTRSTTSIPLRPEEGSSLWQEPAYYENYIRNVYPASLRQDTPQGQGYDQPAVITEEEMQRQQMLMLLLQKEQPAAGPAASTFRIDWQGRYEEDPPPAQGYYAPGQSSTPTSTYPGPSPSISRQLTNLQPWDGVWRTPIAAPMRSAVLPGDARTHREERRREIEMGK